METNTKTKRIVTKIGDVFCVEFPDNTKGYFQYIANDLTQLNSSVIRVFENHYPIDSEETIDNIVKDKVAFYAHTILRIGIQFNAWHKVGNSKNIGDSELQNVIFGYTFDTKIEFKSIIHVDPLTNWTVWHINGNLHDIGVLPDPYHGIVELGSVLPYHLITERMERGYNTDSRKIYEIMKRKPRPEYKSYIKDMSDGKDIYICFKGDYFEKAVIPIDGKLTRISHDEAVSNNMEIISKKFSDTNWKTQNFITEDEFNQVWDTAL